MSNDFIYCANVNGSDPEIIVSEYIDVVGKHECDVCAEWHTYCVCGDAEDLAVDWVSNKLYWVDTVWARIEAMDLETFYRTEVLRTGAHTAPRAIAVEPLNR